MALPSIPHPNEPVTITGLINAGFAAIFAVAVGFFDWDPTQAQLVAVTAVMGFVILVLAFFTRQQVTPTKRVALTHDDVTLIEAGRAEGRPDDG